MSFEIKSTSRFERELKRLTKKYPSLKKEYSVLLKSLATSPTQGIEIGNNCYKIRIAIESKGKGKSGGGRVITFLVSKQKHLVLISIFDKSEKDSVSDAEIKIILKRLGLL